MAKKTSDVNEKFVADMTKEKQDLATTANTYLAQPEKEDYPDDEAEQLPEPVKGTPAGMLELTVTSAKAIVKKPENGGLFRVLNGCHIDIGPPGCECGSCKKNKGTSHQYMSYHTYKTLAKKQGAHPTFDKKDPLRLLPAREYENDLIETDVDLCERFNTPGLTPKFQRVN